MRVARGKPARAARRVLCGGLLPATLALLAAGLGACQREPAAPEAAEAAVAQEQVASATPAPEGSPADAIVANDASAAQAITAQSPGFDSKAFAGRFACVACSGGEHALALSGDGRFSLDDEGSGEPLVGTWTVEEAGRRLRLDPDSKQDPDLVFRIDGNDRIAPVGAAGQPAGGVVLQRLP